jgi:hypothetical protein
MQKVAGTRNRSQTAMNKAYGARKKRDAARISASLIFGSNERLVLYSSASIFLNLPASFSMSDTVYSRFSGGNSGLSLP